MAYTTIDKSDDYFNILLWTGNGASPRALSGLGFNPDWIWTKARNSGSVNHAVWDIVRGGNIVLNPDENYPDNNGAAIADHGVISSFTSPTNDGFTVADGSSAPYPRLTVNDASIFGGAAGNYVGWCWKAGGTASSNTNGTITSNVSANTTSGFSIVSYTGNGSNGASFGHGLGVKPKIVLIKNRTTAKNWVYWQDTTNNGTSDVRLCLNLTNANFNNFHVTFGTSTITLGDTDDAWNKSGDNLIAYCFAEKQGYSKFGSYTGNGSTDGTFVYTGFKPAFVMLKSSSSGSVGWITHDNKRIGFNPNNYYVEPNNSNAESADTDKILLLSNGFKLTSTSATWNASGGSYIYMAFAEEPLVGDNPATAR